MRVARTIMMLAACLLILPVRAGADSAQQKIIEGVVRNDDGSPLVGATISIFREDWVEEALLTTKTGADGRFSLKDLLPGRYIISVIMSGYKPLSKSLVTPLNKLPLFLVLSSMTSGEEAEENWNVKNVLRASRDKELIFRAKEGEAGDTPEPRVLKEGDDLSTVRGGSVQITTNQPLGSLGYNVLPGSVGGGFSTKFAYVEPLGSNSSYIITGTLSTGFDSQYRLSNLLNYQMGNEHNLQFNLDYAKMGVKQRAIHDLADANPEEFEDEILQTIEPIQHISLGIQDAFQISEPLTMVYGFDINYSTVGQGNTFISPRFQVYFTPTEDFSFRFMMNNQRQTDENTIRLPEGQMVTTHSPFNIAKLGKDTFVTRSGHMEMGLSFLLDDRTDVEISTFLDRVTGTGYPFVAILKNPGASNLEYALIPDEFNDSHGFRFRMTRQWTRFISTSVLYIYGSGTEVDESGDMFTTLNDWAGSLKKRFFNTFSTSFNASIPETGTDISTVYRHTTGDSLLPMDPYSNYRNLDNDSLSVFVRQSIPLFSTSLGKWEAILDIRNILNQGVSVYQTPTGDLILVRSPRSFRGGISFRF
jgi:hypothetical protein